MKLLWTSAAERDRSEIFDFIDQENPSAARSMDLLIEQSINSLTIYPLLGQPGHVPETRELVIHQSYRIVYEVNEVEIRILAVVHTSRDWPSESSH